MEVELNLNEKRHVQELLAISELIKHKDMLGKLTIYKDRKFCVVGRFLRKVEPSKRFKIAVEFLVMNKAEFKVVINFNREVKDSSDIFRITKLKLDLSRKNGVIQLQLLESPYTDVLSLVPDIIGEKSQKNEVFLSTPRSRDFSSFSLERAQVNDPLWKVLIMDLRAYAFNTNEGVRFDMKNLLSIAENVRFVGIVTKIQLCKSPLGDSFYLKLRDIATNDSVSLYVSFRKEDSLSYLNQIEKYFILHVTATRSISKNLSIYCKLFLSSSFDNLKILSTHVPCKYSICPCKLENKRFSQNFAPYSLLNEIEPFLLFRVMFRVQLKILIFKDLTFREKCKKCNEWVYKNKENKCCENADLDIDVILTVLADDSSGIAECQLTGLENIIAFLELKKSCINDIKEIIKMKVNHQIRFQEFPISLKNHIKNMGPIFKYCIAKPFSRNKTDYQVNLYREFLTGPSPIQLVNLNNGREDVNVSIKVFKVMNN